MAKHHKLINLKSRNITKDFKRKFQQLIQKACMKNL